MEGRRGDVPSGEEVEEILGLDRHYSYNRYYHHYRH